MEIKLTFWLIELSVLSVKSSSSAPAPSFAEMQTIGRNVYLNYVVGDAGLNTNNGGDLLPGLYMYKFIVNEQLFFSGKLIVN